eukprot:SAG31_NODE_13575_length_860_cov_0.950066_1_plen_153_part_01
MVMVAFFETAVVVGLAARLTGGPLRGTWKRMPSMPWPQVGSDKATRAQRGSGAHLGQSLGSARTDHRDDGAGGFEKHEMMHRRQMQGLKMLVEDAREDFNKWRLRLEVAQDKGGDLEVLCFCVDRLEDAQVWLQACGYGTVQYRPNDLVGHQR